MYNVKHFFEPNSCSLSYLVYDEKSRDAVIIDPFVAFDYPSGEVHLGPLQEVIQFIKDHKLNLHYVLETHVHADHISGANYLKQKFKSLKVAIHENITLVQEKFKTLLNLENFSCDASDFDVLFKGNQIIKAGSLNLKVVETPGHTPACSSFIIGDMIFCGDTLFMPDFGTGRCDFPGGDAAKLYDSITGLYSKYPESKVYVGHDYMPGKRDLEFQTTISHSKTSNCHLSEKTSKEEFIKFRTDRDKGLSYPKNLYPSIQINIRAGKLPGPQSNGRSYLKVPLKVNGSL
ncbi:MBL fold metallo-hydrolase [bacterium]|nr:MBL fold metallo-hydrolase [bacterium]